MTPDAFKILRKQSKLTQAQLATRLGVSRLTVHNWESGRFAMPVDIVPRLSTANVLAPAHDPADKASAKRVKDTLEAYRHMRGNPAPLNTHAHIMSFWQSKGFTPSPEAQAAIMAEFPDILETTKG